MSHPSSPRHGHSASQGASDAAAALRGASLAFSKTNKPKPEPPVKRLGAGAGNSALSAATASAQRDRSRSRSRSPAPSLQRRRLSDSEESVEHGGSVRDRLARLSNANASSIYLQLPASGRPANGHESRNNPSYIAAALAASRSTSPSPAGRKQISVLPGHQASVPNMRAAAAAMSSSRDRHRRTGSTLSNSASSSNTDLPDTTPIPGTDSLISMFERHPPEGATGGHDPKDVDNDTSMRRSATVRQQRLPKPQVRPMTPERSLSPQKPRMDDSTPKADRATTRSEPSSPAKSETKLPQLKPKPTPKPKPKPQIRPRKSVDGNNQAENHERLKSEPPHLAESPPRSAEDRQDHIKEKRSQAAPGSQRLARSSLPPAGTVGTLDVDPGLLSTSEPQPPVMRGGHVETEEQQALVAKPRKPRPAPIQKPQSPIVSRSTAELISPKPTRPVSQPKLVPPTPPQPRGTKPKSQMNTQGSPSPLNSQNLAALQGRHTNSEDRPTTSGTNETSSSNDTFVSASSIQTPMPSSPPRRADPIRRPPSTASMPTNTSPTRSLAPSLPRRNPAAASTSNLPLNSLSNAIMAGSLAASRLTPSNTGTSSKSLSAAPALPPRAKSPRLRQTMRQPVAVSSDDEAKRIKYHHGRHTRSNKSHFHHEGARKRWREEITPGERKRYEALWASNKGVGHEYLLPETTVRPFTVPRDKKGNYVLRESVARSDWPDYVINIVVREIWNRSRLPPDELGEVWDLVDPYLKPERVGGADKLPPPGMLGKQEFVVGTWIIDQRLKGRKIPTKVHQSVWDSAKGVTVWSPKTKGK